MNAEGRYVAAGLYPPDEFDVSELQLNLAAREVYFVIQSINLSIIQIDDVEFAMWDPLEIKSAYLSKRFDVIKKVWSLKADDDKVKEIAFDDSRMTKRIDGKTSRYDDETKIDVKKIE